MNESLESPVVGKELSHLRYFTRILSYSEKIKPISRGHVSQQNKKKFKKKIMLSIIHFLKYKIHYNTLINYNIARI